jgi:AhpC/TSA antioxidant enzyme
LIIAMSLFSVFQQTQRQRVSDGAITSIVSSNPDRLSHQTLILVWPQLGDFDPLEYAWWIRRSRTLLTERQIQVRAVAIGDRAAGQAFCAYTGFPEEDLLIDPTAELHRQLDLYPGLQAQLPGFSPAQNRPFQKFKKLSGLGFQLDCHIHAVNGRISV